jgi:hypothetical protein
MYFGALASQSYHIEDVHSTPIVDQHAAMVFNMEQIAQLDDGTGNFIYPMAFHNDVLHYGGMLKE